MPKKHNHGDHDHSVLENVYDDDSVMFAGNASAVIFVLIILNTLYTTWANKKVVIDMTLLIETFEPHSIVVLFVLLALTTLSIFIPYIFANLVCKRIVPHGVEVAAAIGTSCYLLAGNYYLLHRFVPNYPVFHGAVLSFYSVTMTMKCLSFYINNYKLSLGVAEKDIGTETVHYPQNLKLDLFLYFAVAPTVVYASNFPRISRPRDIKLIATQFIEGLFMLFMMYTLVSEFIIPVVHDETYVAVAVLRLSLYGLVVFFCLFYFVCHNLLNFVAEITGFADRNAYSDWWTSRTFSDFWRRWNTRVHDFLLHDVYIYFREKGLSTVGARIVSFVISGALYEYVMLVSFRRVRFFLTIAMLLQVSFMGLFNRPFFTRKRWGNLTIYIVLAIAVPLLIVVYMR